MLGVLVNLSTVLLGGLLGLLLGSRVPQRLRDTVMKGMALSTAIIGIKGALATEDVMVLIICIVLGALLGEWADIEKRLEAFGHRAEKLLMGGRDGGESQFVQGFMAASLLFCVGPMSIIGPLESGLTGNHATQFAKATMDGVAAVFFAASMGPGALLSALTVLLYQGGITLCAGFIAPILSEGVIREMSAVGGVIIMGIGLNMAGATKIRLGNLLPSLFLPAAYMPLAAFVGGLF